MRTVAVFLVAITVNAACVPVTTDRILARDLAKVDPVFESSTPDQVISFSPLPGAQRTFSARELAIIATRLALPESARFAPICFERSTAPVDPEQMKVAMAAALTIDKDQIEILDFSRYSVPAGRVEFPRAGLGIPRPSAPDEPMLWRGHVVYENSRSAPIWAKVKVLVEAHLITATIAIKPGQVIQKDQLATVVRKQFPFTADFVNSREEVIGKTVRRSVAAGDPLRTSMLEQSREIAQGDTVEVSALSGAAQITFEAHAQSGGRKGDSILVQNPSNGRSFRAKVVDKGKVEVRPSGNL